MLIKSYDLKKGKASVADPMIITVRKRKHKSTWIESFVFYT